MELAYTLRAPPLYTYFMISLGNSFSSTPCTRVWTGVGGNRIKNWKGVTDLERCCLLAAAKFETKSVSIIIENAIAHSIYIYI
jgi:hypothetical protein